MTTLSDGRNGKPRVFAVENFMSVTEADGLVGATGGFKPSLTGFADQGADRDYTQEALAEIRENRNSDNAWDDDSELPTRIKKRAYELLRIPFDQESADGIQVLRYNVSQAYNTHTDFFDDEDGPEEDFYPDAHERGNNRFATVFLYLSDVEAGGATVFPFASALPGQLAPKLTNETFLRGIGISNGSFQEEMTKDCESATNLKVYPKKGSAIIFYSQTPHGVLDYSSEHGSCPVYRGLKFAANLWVWNTAMPTDAENQAEGDDDDDGDDSTNSAGEEGQKASARWRNPLEEDIELWWRDEDLSEEPDLRPRNRRGRQAEMEKQWQHIDTIRAGGTAHLDTYVGHDFQATVVDGVIWHGLIKKKRQVVDFGLVTGFVGTCEGECKQICKMLAARKSSLCQQCVDCISQEPQKGIPGQTVTDSPKNEL